MSVAMTKKTAVITDENFEAEVINSQVPVLLDFWAEWCQPCKMISPVLDEFAENPAYVGRLKIGKLNVDDNDQTPVKYGVRGIPTLILFKNGQVEATKVGALSKSQLADFFLSSVRFICIC